MKTSQNLLFWLLLVFSVFGPEFVMTQDLTFRMVSVQGKVPSKHELDLLFAMNRNTTLSNSLHEDSSEIKTSIVFREQRKHFGGYATLNFVRYSLPYSNTIVFPFESSQFAKEQNRSNGFKNKPYSLYHMPTYDEINIALPKSRQVLNYFLTLASSLYVTSKQSGE